MFQYALYLIILKKYYKWINIFYFIFKLVTEDPSLPHMTQSDIRKMLNDLDASNADREALKQKCHELENQVNLLQDEKTNMSVEFEQLQAQVRQLYTEMNEVYWL